MKIVLKQNQENKGINTKNNYWERMFSNIRGDEENFSWNIFEDDMKPTSKDTLISIGRLTVDNVVALSNLLTNLVDDTIKGLRIREMRYIAKAHHEGIDSIRDTKAYYLYLGLACELRKYNNTLDFRTKIETDITNVILSLFSKSLEDYVKLGKEVEIELVRKWVDDNEL